MSGWPGPPEVVWRYLPRCRVKHALTDPLSEDAECGTVAMSPLLWLGTGSQHEYETAAALPGCRRCVAKVGEPDATQGERGASREHNAERARS